MQIRKLIGIIRRAKEQHIRKQKEQKIIDERNRNRRNAQIASISPTVKPRSSSPTRSISPPLTRKKKGVIKIAPVQAAPVQAAPVQAAPVQGRVLQVIPKTKRRGQINIVDSPPVKQTYNQIPTEAEIKAFSTGLEWEHRVNGDYGKMWIYKDDIDKYKKLQDTSLTNSDTLTIYDMDKKQVYIVNGKGGYKYLNETVVIDILGNKSALELKDYFLDFETEKRKGFGIHFAKSKLVGNKSFMPYFIKIGGKWKLYDIWYKGKYYTPNPNPKITKGINIVEQGGWISPNRNLDYYALIRMYKNGEYNAYSYHITEDLDSWNPEVSPMKGENGETLYYINFEKVPDEFYFVDGKDEQLSIIGVPEIKTNGDNEEYYIPTDKLHIIKYD